MTSINNCVVNSHKEKEKKRKKGTKHKEIIKKIIKSLHLEPRNQRLLVDIILGHKVIEEDQLLMRFENMRTWREERV